MTYTTVLIYKFTTFADDATLYIVSKYTDTTLKPGPTITWSH